MQTILERLADHAATQPDKPFLVAHEDTGSNSITYGDLLAKSQAMAAALRARAVDGVVFIVLKPTLDLYPAFLGSMLAGWVPSFLPFPTPKQDPVLCNLFLEYLLPVLHGVSVLAGGYYTGDSLVPVEAGYVRVPDFATYDVGAKYETVVDKVPTVFRLYATNILNAQYWQTFTNVHPGDPRTLRLSAAMRF